jgi:hypothetical protein
VKDRKHQCEPYLGRTKGFSHQVRVGSEVVALTINEDYGNLLALTLKRIDLLKSLSGDHHSVLSVLLDLLTYIKDIELKRASKPLRRSKR